MKIVLSSYWRKSNLFMSFIIIFVIILSIQLQSMSNPNDDKWIVLFTGLYVGMFLFLVLKSFRFMTYVKINENEIESYLLNSKLCKVDYDKSIYYVIFDGRENKTTTRKYIAVSNKIFEFHDTSPVRVFPWDEKPFLASYDVKNQIVMPYDEKTILMLPIGEWNLIN